MDRRGAPAWSPVARFSIALGLVLAVTALALGGLTAYLIGRYVEDETVAFTQDAVAGHFGTIFQNSVFQGSLSDNDEENLERSVIFHLSVYNIVATRFFAPDGTIVFSYDSSEIGRRLDPIQNASLAAALAGRRTAAHRAIVADVRYATPGFTYSEASAAAPPADHSAHAVALSSPDIREVQTLETWVPVSSDGKVIGTVTVWRDVEPLNVALWNIQAGIGLIIAAAAMLLWLVLRGVYARSPLTENEWYTMKTHPDLGAKIIANVPFLQEVAVIIRAHHERWDGNGYPEGLAAEDIPLGARIFAVADSFDAMTSDRPYRRGRALDEAITEIERCSGTQFDPQVVHAFLAVSMSRIEAIHANAPFGLRLVRAAAS